MIYLVHYKVIHVVLSGFTLSLSTTKSSTQYCQDLPCPLHSHLRSIVRINLVNYSNPHSLVRIYPVHYKVIRVVLSGFTLSTTVIRVVLSGFTLSTTVICVVLSG
ncbi:hypothetical protein DPMN_023298 [Dreissena polymorpha]|uniref:Uncharacterized protein n=1 Tax=Dreissena polymorpha TaxID=45954 RepID=A0A9D4R9S3_DREPO|nr:hypothetical protein DPMN_023298 [Dreissena polymorpha]